MLAWVFTEHDDVAVWKLRRLGAVAAAAVLTAACSSSPSASPAVPEDNLVTGQGASTPATTVGQAEPVPVKVGEPFTLGNVRLTVLSVQDPFPPTPQTQPRPGNRFMSIRYEALNHTPEAQNASDLPSVEVRDSTGVTYQSEHGRVSVVAGSRNPGELVAGKRMESNLLFEVPASETGLRVAFRLKDRSGDAGVVVNLD